MEKQVLSKQEKEYEQKKDSLADRRSRFTREVIRNTYLDMLEERNKKITVAALCQKANISRGTFYIHYQDIVDVKDDVEEEFFKEACRAHKDVISDKVIGHEKEFVSEKANDRRWNLLYYEAAMPPTLQNRISEYAIGYALETDFKDLPWSEEEKRVAALCIVAAAMAVDQDAHSHPWKEFDKTNQFYDRLIRNFRRMILRGDFLRR